MGQERMTPGYELLQLSDTHIFASREEVREGVATFDCLRRTLDHAMDNTDPDVVLLTGDIAEDYSREAYQTVREVLSEIGKPVYCLPGNHDHLGRMVETLSSPPFHFLETLRMGPWMVPMLSTWDGDRGGGCLGNDELARLASELESTDADHVMVCLHHCPVDVGSAWLDAVGLDDGQELLTLVERYPRVRAVLCGHIHQELDVVHRGVRLLGSPSTCYQFKPGSIRFTLDDRASGYRSLKLFEDGHIETRVGRVDS
jgi:Icc protein